MILIYKPEGNDQRVNPDIKGMIAFLPSLILVISNNKLTDKAVLSLAGNIQCEPRFDSFNRRFNNIQATDIKTDYSIGFLRLLCIFWYIKSLILTENKPLFVYLIPFICLLSMSDDVTQSPVIPAGDLML